MIGCAIPTDTQSYNATRTIENYESSTGEIYGPVGQVRGMFVPFSGPCVSHVTPRARLRRKPGTRIRTGRCGPHKLFRRSYGVCQPGGNIGENVRVQVGENIFVYARVAFSRAF